MSDNLGRHVKWQDEDGEHGGRVVLYPDGAEVRFVHHVYADVVSLICLVRMHGGRLIWVRENALEPR